MSKTTNPTPCNPTLLARLRGLVVERSPDTDVADLRGRTTTRADRSEHRRHAWRHEDLLA